MDEHGEGATGGSLCHCERLSPFGKCRSNSIEQTLQVEACFRPRTLTARLGI